LVKSFRTHVGYGFAESLVKSVSLNFLHLWKIVKKTLLDMRQFASNSMGETERQATIQV